MEEWRARKHCRNRRFSEDGSPILQNTKSVVPLEVAFDFFLYGDDTACLCHVADGNKKTLGAQSQSGNHELGDWEKNAKFLYARWAGIRTFPLSSAP
ncbi:hypothetical protein HPP92_013882 [Vanilla planifolia]|uniref:Uncharacterized protein n=1 Tax=Vanilla planifolia TaxID=51239 RepID=A0A835R3A8_VANPL|nr:hypothetical protein HPP92_013882 [Vanilla planifolia]